MSKEFENTVNALGSAFDEFKEKYNARLDEIEARSNRQRIGPGSATVTDEAPDTVRGVVRREQSFKALVMATDEASREQAEKYRRDGVTLGGILKAMVMGGGTPAIRAALSEGTDSAGGFTVPTIISAEFIDRLRKRMRVVQSGARTVQLTESYKQNLARITGDVAPAWRAEAGAVAETDATLDSVAFVAKSLANVTKVSRELLQDSLNIEDILERSISQSFALELDRAALLGSGASNQPTGIVNTSGIGTVTSAANGDQITNYSKLVTAKQTLLDANVDGPYSAIMAPRTEAKFGSLLDTTNQPLQRPQFLDDVTFRSTTQIGVADTQGTASNASKIIVGDYSQLMFGVRSDLRVEVLRELYAGNLQLGFLSHMRADIQLEHAAAFVNVSGLIP